MSQSELEIMQDGLDSANTSGSTLDGLIDDINIHISSLEAKLITKGDDLDQAIVDSVHRTIEQAQNCLTSSDEGELNSMLQTLEEHAGLFSA
jgi:hypothetical protein